MRQAIDLYGKAGICVCVSVTTLHGTAVDTAVLLPVHVQAEGGQTDVAQKIARPGPRTIKRDVSGPLIEIEMSGVLVRLRGTVDEASLCSVLRAVRGST